MATLTDNSDGTAEIDLDSAGVFSDSDGTIDSYSAQSSDTGVATVSVSGGVLTVSAQSDGSATITVTATDNDGATVDDTFTVTVDTSSGGGGKPTQPGTFDKTGLATDYESIYDKAFMVVPLWEGSGTTAVDLVSGEDGDLVFSTGSAIQWGDDSEGVHLDFGSTNNTAKVDFGNTSLNGASYTDLTVIAVMATTENDRSTFFAAGKANSEGVTLSMLNGTTPDFYGISFVRGNDTINDGTTYVVQGRRDTSKSQDHEVRVDKNAWTSDNRGKATITTSTGPVLGSRAYEDDNGFNGKLRAVYVFNDAALSDAELDLIVDDPYGLIRTS